MEERAGVDANSLPRLERWGIFILSEATMRRSRLDIYGDYPNSLIANTINEWIKSDRDRRILHYKLIDGYTYEHIAEIMEMSPRRIQDIVYNSEDKIYNHL